MKAYKLTSSQNHMGTTFHLTVSCIEKDVRRTKYVLSEAQREIDSIEKELSEYLPSSVVSVFNQSPADYPVVLSTHVYNVLCLSKEMSSVSNGAFNCFIKGEKSSFLDVEIREDSKVAVKRKPGIHLGFGAIGKGYALDKVRERLNQEGLADFCLSAGGSSIILSGFAAEGQSWEWAWSWDRPDCPKKRGVTFEHLSGEPVAIGVSGNQEQEHLRPAAPAPAGELHLSSLVGASSAARADALSTACFVMGSKEAQALAESQDVALATIRPDGIADWNRKFHGHWGNVC